jgi:hypothetical protein
MAARSKAWFCGRSLAGIVGSNPAEGMDICLLWVVCCHVEVSASDWSLIWTSPTQRGVSEYDREAWTMRRPWPTTGCRAMEKKKSAVLVKCFVRPPPPPNPAKANGIQRNIEGCC